MTTSLLTNLPTTGWSGTFTICVDTQLLDEVMVKVYCGIAVSGSNPPTVDPVGAIPSAGTKGSTGAGNTPKV